jgi:hypothetical protein
MNHLHRHRRRLHHHHRHHHEWLYSPSGPWPPLIPFHNHILRHTVGLLGRVISSSQGLYLRKTTQHRRTKDKHPCLKRDSDPRPSIWALRSHASDRAATGSACNDPVHKNSDVLGYRLGTIFAAYKPEGKTLEQRCLGQWAISKITEYPNFETSLFLYFLFCSYILL